MPINIRYFLCIAFLGLISGGCNTHISSIPTAMQESTVTVIPATDPRITVMGRAEPLANGDLRFAYPGVTVRFNFVGRQLSLRALSSSGQSYLDVRVDNNESQIIKLPSTGELIMLFSSANIAAHQVEIIHRSETWHGLVTLQHLEINGGDLMAPPELPKKRLLILGDSVTCGEAIERAAECKKDTSWWNPRLSYGMLIAATLDAQINLVCYGGRGLIRSWNGKTDEANLPDFFELAIADPQSPVSWDHTMYAPDLILSAIGTNDFSVGIPARETYVSAYVKLVKRLLDLHPQAQVVLTEGAILNGDKKVALSEYLAETARRVKDPRLHIISSNHYPGDACDAHPTKEQHAAMAKDLAPALRKLMGW